MRYLCGDYCLDTQRYELHRGSVPIPLRPKVYQVLAYLLTHADRVVLKQELLEHVWPGQFVGDAALNSYIMDIRKALGDDGYSQRLLRTVRGRGYRFVASVEVQDPAPAEPPSRLVHAPTGETVASTAPPPALPAEPLPAADPSGPAAPDADGEHKLVTILCGALAEAPALATRLGPERWYRLLQTVVGLAQEVLQPYAGTLTLATNDGFTAVFGMPVAQEDHARRAVLAALELRQRLHDAHVLRAQLAGGLLTLSMGLDSGLVVVGSLGQDPRRLATAVGTPLHLATRLQQQAAPGMILLSAATYHLVHAEVRAAPYGTLTLDWQPTPVSVYAVQGLLRRRAGVAGQGPRAPSPFVGRARELALLQDHLALAMAGQGQVVGVVGEPGMGKTRLLAEFCRRVPGAQVTVYEGRCLSYGQATPYLPVRDLVRQVCGLMDGDKVAGHTAAVQQRLHERGLTAEEDVALLLQLLDLPVAPECLARISAEARQVRTFALLRHLILDEAQRQPLVLVVENLHWSDPTSEAWLASLVERLAGAAVLLLGTYRPGYQPAWGAHTAVTQVVVPPLGAQDSRTVVQAVLGAVTLPEARLRAMVAQAAGNPFFLEELAWHAVEQGGRETPATVPETVHAVLAARLDRLSSNAKHLVQTAAVVGMQMTWPLLQAVTGLSDAELHAGLTQLQAVEFLYETQVVPEHTYTFKHALTHEVAYHSLLQERRRGLHARIVEAFEALAPDRAAAPVERLAHHALRGEVWDKAVTYGQQAGARADAHAALREAALSFDQALQALAHLPESRDTRAQAIDLRLALGSALNQLGEYGRGLTLAGEAEALARALNDRTRLARVLAGMAFGLRATGDLDGSIAAGQQALALADTLGDRSLQRGASYHLGLTYQSIGAFERAAALLRRNVEAADREAGTPTTRVRIISQAWLAQTLGALGEFAEGRRHGEEALHLATLAGQRNTPIIAHNCLGHLYLTQGDLEAAIWVLEPGLALGRAAGDRNQLRRIAAALGYAYALQGRLAEGRALLEEAISESLRTGGLTGLAGRVAWLSEVCRLAGRGQEAWQHARQALDLAQQQKERHNEALALHQLGVVQAHTDPPDVAQAEAYYQQALALAEELGMRPLQAHCHRGLGTLYTKIAQREHARAELAAAIDLYRAMEMTFWLPKAEAALEEAK
jgi:DNA-binding winged helix-turn-helix (wHTH) protein/tetratricopeptide (TPR) repeat protein